MFSSFCHDAGLDERPFSRKAKIIPKAWPDPVLLDKIISLLKKSKSPIIIAGHGVWWSKSEDKLKQVGDKLKFLFLMYPIIKSFYQRIVTHIWV